MYKMMKVNIVCEIGCNHLGNLNIAKEMIVQSKECGADYVKFQKRDLNNLNPDIKNRPYDNPHSFGKTYGEHREYLEFNEDQFEELSQYAKKYQIGFFATPFDITSLLFLIKLGVPYLKLGSTQIHDDRMINDIINLDCKYMPPFILSTGMCTIADVLKKFAMIKPLILLQATSCYPCEEVDVNLEIIKEYLTIFGCQVGLSGHYVSGNGAIEAAAVALGATWIERHFTLDRTWKGTDQAASLEPEGLKNVVKAVRTVERAMGNNYKSVLNCELPTLRKIKS